MKDYIHKRVMDLSTYIIDRRATVRQAAKRFGVSKSTVHKDVTERLYGLNRNLAREVKRVLEANKAERHLRGGEATRRKYQTRAESGTKKGGSTKKT
ncbi:MAG: sporulation transcriptional regulator SpoIIID [Bacillota bacterium]